MMKAILGGMVLGLLASITYAGTGIVTRSSPHSFAQTLERIEAVLAAKGATVFARVD